MININYTLQEKILCDKLKQKIKESKLSNKDLSNIVVFKPWGFEYLNYESDDKSCCSWFLHIYKGKGTSMHCHSEKKTVLTVISGEVLLLLYHRSITILKPGDCISFDKKVFHAMYALTDDTRLIEIETPSNKPDAIRMLDCWDRVNEPYESKCLIMRIDNDSN